MTLRALESSGMAWLKDWGIPTPALTRHEKSTRDLDLALTGPGSWVVKPDTAVGGKGLKGLVSVCRSIDEVHAAFDRLNREEGALHKAVLIEEYVEGPEFYFSISLDEQSRSPVMRLASAGGVGFDASSDAARVVIDPALGLLESDVNHLLRETGMAEDRALSKQIAVIAHRAWRAYVASEATLLEVNPFRRSSDGPVAVGIAVEFDSNATSAADAVRPPNLRASETFRSVALTEREKRVAETNRIMSDTPAISFIELDGDVSVLVSGGGAALLCMDHIHDLGLDSACYMDSSPGAGPEKLGTLFETGMSVPNIKAILFGAAVISLDDVSRLAKIFIDAVQSASIDASEIPMVIRLAGPNEVEAHKLLSEAIPQAHILGRESTLEDACDLVAQLVQSRDSVLQSKLGSSTHA